MLKTWEQLNYSELISLISTLQTRFEPRQIRKNQQELHSVHPLFPRREKKFLPLLKTVTKHQKLCRVPVKEKESVYSKI